MKPAFAALFALMLMLAGCVESTDPATIEEALENLDVETDTDGDGLPDSIDDDDDNDAWLDADEINCVTDPLLATDTPLDTDADGECDLLDFDDDGDGAFDDVEDLCGSDSLAATSVPGDLDGDGICDALDTDTDQDGFADDLETTCGSDPLNATSLPADLDGDGTCDALDGDDDGDGVADEDDYAPNDPTTTEAVGGCMDESAFNYNATVERDDGTCFTLEIAEAAVEQAMGGLVAMEFYDPGNSMAGMMVMNASSGAHAVQYDLLDPESGEAVMSVAYVFDGNGLVGVDQSYPETDDFDEPTGDYILTSFLVSENYFESDIEDDGWSHCELDGELWYCTDLFDYEGDVVYNEDSETMTLHQFQCDDGTEILLEEVNDGEADCDDASDEPSVVESNVFMCDNGDSISLLLVNDQTEDCADGSDEPQFIDELLCNDGYTISSYSINDGYKDCEDGEDEPAYDLDETSTYTCEDGSVVFLSEVNDGVDDCSDGTDERPTSGEYEPLFEFECHSSEFEEDISLSMVNDGTDDCPEGEDETMYDSNGTETSEFECYDVANDTGYMINLSMVNDGTVDCDLRQDEAALAGNVTTKWFGLDADEEYNGDCFYGGEMFEIPWSWVNDGVEDCDDGSDESSYDANGTETSVMFCDDGTDIPLSWANDGTEDCADGEDETVYAMMSDYLCENGESIEFDWVNDGYADCEDDTDEPVYDVDELTNFTCDDGSLIAFSLANNGQEDCSDGEDEPSGEEVEYSSFDCASGDTIPLSLVNDGTEDCPAGDDEPSYDPISQSEVSTYQCLYSGETIALSLVNDGVEEDCEDNTDEPEYGFEETSEYTCSDGSDDIPLSWVNDGYENCMDGSDEAQYDFGEDISVLVCNDGSEITVSQYDDGVEDCDDGSDEEPTFECVESGQTIPFRWVNDGGQDCQDGSDESDAQDTNEIVCNSEDQGIITASQIRDGLQDCQNGWDELEFEPFNNCLWDDDDGWMCDEIYLSANEEWMMWEEHDDNDRALLVLGFTIENENSMEVHFDAETHEFLFMMETIYEIENEGDEPEVVEEVSVTSVAYNNLIAEALMIDSTTDVHAPPFAVMFYGEPMSLEDDREFTCDDELETVPFSSINDGVEDCSDASDEPVVEMTEESYFYCNADDMDIFLSSVNDGVEDCSDGEDEDDGTGTMEYYCPSEDETDWGGEGDGMIPFSSVNDGMDDCLDGEDEPYYHEDELSDWPCEDGAYDIPLSYVNDGGQDCEDGSDEAPVGEGHGFGEYQLSTVSAATWNLGEGDSTMELVFMFCDSFETTSSEMSGDYLLPQSCGEELARYTLADVMAGEIVGLMIWDYDEDGVFNPDDDLIYIDEDFELEGWNTLRLSTPEGEYADENPEVVLPAAGAGFALMAMLGAAMMARRPEQD